LFACRRNACRSQMAAAFAQMLAGDRLEVFSAGSEPAENINPDMEKAMAEKGIDVAFRRPRALEPVMAESPPEIIVTMGCGETCPFPPGARRIDWDLPDPDGRPPAFMRSLRDQVEDRIAALIGAEL
jgi:arsenate reductase (thioredoxin)